MLLTAEKTRRQAERIAVSIPVRVEVRGLQQAIWREITQLESVSGIGAGFYLSRLLEVGQLVCLTMAIDQSLRRYDHDAEQYTVWCVVRHCHRTIRNKFSVYHIGVAFIGREPPVGYRTDPTASYRIEKLKDNGFFSVKKEENCPVSRRRQRRYAIPIEIYIAVYDANDNIIAHEKTVTENISEGGASVFSGLRLNIGDSVKLIKQHGGFSADAVVRSRRLGKDNLPRLHLEFVNTRFPLDGID